MNDRKKLGVYLLNVRERDQVFIAIYRMLDRDRVLIYKKKI